MARMTAAVKRAVRNELERTENKPLMRERLRMITAEIAAMPDTRLKPDRACSTNYQAADSLVDVVNLNPSS